MNTAIFIKNLRETYDNGFEALKGISLEVEQADSFALLGPNSAATNWPGFAFFARGWRDIQFINFFASCGRAWLAAGGTVPLALKQSIRCPIVVQKLFKAFN